MLTNVLINFVPMENSTIELSQYFWHLIRVVVLNGISFQLVIII